VTKKTRKTISLLTVAVMFIFNLAISPIGMLNVTAESVWDGTIATSFAGGSGTQADPWQISNGSQLAYLMKQVTAGTAYSGNYFKQTADILLNDLSNLNSWRTTAPSNPWVAGTGVFSGTYDGDYFAVRGIYINTGTLDYSGLFGATSNATLKNIRLEDSYIYSTKAAQTYFGGIVGWVAGGQITNCYNSATVIIDEPTSSNHHMAGGIAGMLNSGVVVSQCYNTGSIRCAGNYHSGSRKVAGGITGCINGNGTISAIIQDCYNSGTITATGIGTTALNAAGGIAGYTLLAAYNIKNCYNTGLVTATAGANYVGGVAGKHDVSASVTNCYYLDGTAALNYYGGNTTCKKTAGEMKATDFLTTLNAAAFVSDINNINKGYPVFSWQNDIETVTVTYDATYGEGGPESQGYYAGTYITPDFTNIPTGSYGFLGWATSVNATTPEYTASQNATFAVDSDITLYAVWNKQKKTFYDNFSAYTDNILAYDSVPTITNYSNSGTPKVIASQSGGSWMLSGVWSGTTEADGNPGGAYIEATNTDSAKNLNKQGLAIRDRWNKDTTVNLDIGNTKIESIQSLNITYHKNDSCRTAVRLMVSSDEGTYYEFGVGTQAFDYNVDDQTTDKIKSKTPYFRKVVDNSEVYCESPAALWSGDEVGYYVLNRAYNWNITIENNTISWTATYKGTRFTITPWTASYVDNNLQDMILGCKYPMACAVKSGYISVFDEVSMKYTSRLPVYEELGNNEILINVQPSLYSSKMKSDTLLVLTAFYSNNHELLGLDVHPVTDLVNNSSFEVAKNATAGCYGKIFIWDGGVSDVAPLDEVTLIN